MNISAPFIARPIATIMWSRTIEFSPNFAVDHELFVNVRARGLYRIEMSASGAVTSAINIGDTLLDQNVQFTVFHLSPAFVRSPSALLMGRLGSVP